MARTVDERLSDLADKLEGVRALLEKLRADECHRSPAAAPEPPTQTMIGQRVLFPHKGKTCRGVVVDITPKGLIIASDELGPTCNRARVEQHNVQAEV